MAMRAEAREWWDEVEGARMRERIERRRLAAVQAAPHGRRRPPRRPTERVGGHPDRIAAWAFAMGCVLVLVAILSAHS
jgi:hypothetical protein